MTTKRSRRKPGGVCFLLAPGAQIGAAEFKAHCLEIMDEVERSGTEVTITKHRKPVARLVPFISPAQAFCGSLKDAVLEERDLISPIDEPWNADAGDPT